MKAILSSKIQLEESTKERHTIYTHAKIPLYPHLYSSTSKHCSIVTLQGLQQEVRNAQSGFGQENMFSKYPSCYQIPAFWKL